MQLDVASYTDIGGREVNEDSMLIRQEESFVIAAVADGLGGHGGGKTASSRAVQSLEEQESLLITLDEPSLRAACAQANRAVLDEQTMSLREVMNFQVGQTLLLNTSPESAIALKCGGIPICKGHIGRVGPFVAVKVDKNLKRPASHNSGASFR